MRQDIAKQTKMREVIQKKLHQMEDQKADVDVQREILKAQIAGVEKGTGCMFYVSATRDSIAGPDPIWGLMWGLQQELRRLLHLSLSRDWGYRREERSPKLNRKYILDTQNHNIVNPKTLNHNTH